jgi:hypothetical protein
MDKYTEYIAKSADSYSLMVRRRKERIPLGSPTQRRQDFIKRVFSEIGLHDVNWMHPAHVACCP